LDTAGFVDIDNAKELLEVTDLVMLSIKHVDEIKHKEITGVSNTKILKFMEYLKEINKPTWIRYVVIPGLTDAKEDIHRLAEFLKDFPIYKWLIYCPITPWECISGKLWAGLSLLKEYQRLIRYPLKKLKIYSGSMASRQSLPKKTLTWLRRCNSALSFRRDKILMIMP
jgi:uncharacterized Fe-S cluster-containing radical SAM superfamily enzyme